MSSPQQRLAAALTGNRGDDPWVPAGYSPEMVGAALVAFDPTIAADMELGRAWREVKSAAASLDGRWWIDLKQIAVDTALVAYQASARKIDYSRWPVIVASGPNPTAALDALRVALTGGGEDSE